MNITIAPLTLQHGDVLRALLIAEPDEPHPVPRPAHGEDVELWLRENSTQSDRVTFGVWRDGTTLVGIVALLLVEHANGAQLSYWIATQHRKQGYGAAAVGAVLDYSFTTLGLGAVQAFVAERNRGSRALLERLGLHGIVHAKSPTVRVYRASRTTGAAR